MATKSALDYKDTDLYKRFLEERDHILKNKWYMSEREGKDVGFERALLDWVTRHRENTYKKK
jgi:ribosomal protein S18